MNRYRMIAGIIVFGSIWGMLECFLGGFNPQVGMLGEFPSGALLGGFFGLGIMAMTRMWFGVRGMAFGMAIVAGSLRYIAPVGTFVICSAIAIVAEGAVFEIIMSRKQLDISRIATRRSLASGAASYPMLAFLGVITGYVIFVTGYAITQILTPYLGTGTIVLADVAAVMPIIIGRGFYAAVLGAVSLPLAVYVGNLHLDLDRIKKEVFYPLTTAASVCCWMAVIIVFY